MARGLPNHKRVVLSPVGVVIIPLPVPVYFEASLSTDFEQPTHCPNLPNPLDPQSRLGYRSGANKNIWRRGQVAKAADCKSAIAGSNPADASPSKQPTETRWAVFVEAASFSFLKTAHRKRRRRFE